MCQNTNQKSLVEYKRYCRDHFKPIANDSGMIEVEPDIEEWPNPYLILFQNDRAFFAIEGINWGYNVTFHFGKLGGTRKYGIHNAICLLEGRNLPGSYGGASVGGYRKALLRDIEEINKYREFFTEIQFLNHIEELDAIQDENLRNTQW